MSDGRQRVDVAYVKPHTLLRPVPPPKLVYLDLNHWILLAKAMSGHQAGDGFKEVLSECQRAVDDGDVILPLSASIYFEVSKIKQHRQRRDLRRVMERLSRFWVVTARSVVSAHEIEALLDKLVGPSPKPLTTLHYLDWGVARAVGMVGGFRIKNREGKDVTAEVRATHPVGPDAFDAHLAAAELELNRQVLAGPSPDEEPEMRRRGWNPMAAAEVAERRAAEELAQVQRFNEDPRWRRGRIRDVVSAREMLIEINKPLFAGLADRGATLEALAPTLDDARRAMDSMPSFDVAVTMKTAYHRNPQHRWTPNDIHDIDALGGTLPYCDVVATDRSAASSARQAGLGERLDTVILDNLSELPLHL